MCNYYFQEVERTNNEIIKFVDFFREEEDPVVLLFFGDHNPYLGDKNIGYNMLDININLDTAEGFYNYYSVPYLIWGNPEAEKVLGHSIKGIGPDISVNFLMNELFSCLGLGGNEYLNATSEIVDNIQVIKAPFYKKDGVVVTQLQESDLQSLNLLEQLQYYWIYDNKYEK